ncbi:MAG: L-seryl-tRNA(Sec) selenium transferase [Acidimicrobiales bacterium]
MPDQRAEGIDRGDDDRGHARSLTPMPDATGAPPARPQSIDTIARSLAATGLPHAVLVDIARRAVADAPGDATARAADLAARQQRRVLQPVVNATGVLLHTNLGRAPLAFAQPAAYTNLELDLTTGTRGSRSDHVAALLALACGAEAALVVNNGAAAVLLALAATAAGREVVVSRGELVEIGGGFRIPEVLDASGAHLVEVGTTNRTRPADFRAATTSETAAYLKVHTSNYRITGFTESVEVGELRGEVPVIADLGSGLLDAACPWLDAGPPDWLAHEPAVRQTLKAGAALVTFSGDKLLGGPQAGIIAGRADLVAGCARHPLARALRPGALVLAALQDVALAYLRRDAGRTIPFWRMATADVDGLARRADALGGGEPCQSVTGGGTLPGVTIPSWGVVRDGDRTARLRAATPPVIARVEDGRTICDLRTVFPEQDPTLAEALAR